MRANMVTNIDDGPADPKLASQKSGGLDLKKLAKSGKLLKRDEQ